MGTGKDSVNAAATSTLKGTILLYKPYTDIQGKIKMHLQNSSDCSAGRITQLINILILKGFFHMHPKLTTSGKKPILGVCLYKRQRMQSKHNDYEFG